MRRPIDEQPLAAGDGEPAETDLARLVATLEALQEGVIVTDADGNEVMRNLAAERFRDARHGDALADHAISGLLEAARRGEAREQELALFGPPREILMLRASPLHRDGVLIGAAAFARDITEARRVESVRRDFVANVSHELKTPVGALGLLAETIAASDDMSVVPPLAEQLVREADRLSRIVDDLLDLSLIEAQEAPTRDRVLVRILVEESVDRLGPMALAHGIPINIESVPGEVAVLCDATQVVSAITNLLDNAVKYSEAGQPVSVRAHVDGSRVVIEIQDSGIGIPAADIERIFERFYRVDRARSRATGGTGLGLSIVRHVAQAHGGEVTVESIEGEGSTFAISLPIATDQGSVPSPETAHVA